MTSPKSAVEIARDVIEEARGAVNSDARVLARAVLAAEAERVAVKTLQKALKNARAFAVNVKAAPTSWGYSTTETIFDRMARAAAGVIDDIDAALQPESKGGG